MRIFLGILVFLSAFAARQVSAEEFSEFEQALAAVAVNYNRAVDSRGTRFEDEYKKHVEAMCAYGKKVQAGVRALKLGGDFDFSGITEEIRNIYQENNRDFDAKKNREKRMVERSQDPAGLFGILKEDMKRLKSMGFAFEDGKPSIRASLETKRMLLAYDRTFQFFTKNESAYRKRPNTNSSSSKNMDDPSFRAVFDRRVNIMKKLADAIMLRIRAKSPTATTQTNLSFETEQMLKNFYELYDSQKKKKTYTVKRAGGSTTVNALHSDMYVSVRNIRAFLVELNNAGFETDAPLSASEAASETDSEDAGSRKSDASAYDAMSADALAADLAKRRNAIYRSNTSMDGFDRDALAAYLTTLSSGQRQEYNAAVKKYGEAGYKTPLAVRSAVLQIHTKLRSEKNSLSKAELIKILKNLDRFQAKKDSQIQRLD